MTAQIPAFPLPSGTRIRFHLLGGEELTGTIIESDEFDKGARGVYSLAECSDLERHFTYHDRIIEVL